MACVELQYGRSAVRHACRHVNTYARTYVRVYVRYVRTYVRTYLPLQLALDSNIPDCFYQGAVHRCVRTYSCDQVRTYVRGRGLISDVGAYVRMYILCTYVPWHTRVHVYLRNTQPPCAGPFKVCKSNASMIGETLLMHSRMVSRLSFCAPALRGRKDAIMSWTHCSPTAT